MNLTKEWLVERNACSDGVVWFESCGETDGVMVLEKLIAKDEEEKNEWANWLIIRIMSHKQALSYAIFAAEQVIALFEKRYPGDSRPRKAIEAAERALKNDTPGNRLKALAAYAAGDAAAAARKQMQERILHYGIGLLEGTTRP